MLLGDVVGAVLVGYEADQPLERVVADLAAIAEITLERFPDV